MMILDSGVKILIKDTVILIKAFSMQVANGGGESLGVSENIFYIFCPFFMGLGLDKIQISRYFLIKPAWGKKRKIE